MSSMSDFALKALGDMILDRLANSKDGSIGEALHGFHRRASEFRKNRQLQEAEALCRRSLKFAQDRNLDKFSDVARNPNYAEGVALMHLGVTFLSQRKLNDAVDCFERAADKFYANSKWKSAGVAWMALGESHKLRCDWEGTVASYQKCLSVLGTNQSDQNIRELRVQIEGNLDEVLDTLSRNCTSEEATPGVVTVEPIPITGTISAGQPNGALSSSNT